MSCRLNASYISSKVYIVAVLISLMNVKNYEDVDTSNVIMFPPSFTKICNCFLWFILGRYKVFHTTPRW
jgi:hypothetical protein